MGKEYSYQIAVTCDDGCSFEKNDKGRVWAPKDALAELLRQLRKIQCDDDVKRLRQLQVTLNLK